MIIDKIRETKEIIVDGELARINLGTGYTMEDYYDFMKLRDILPRYELEYVDDVPWVTTDKVHLNITDGEYTFSELSDHLFDYQKFFTRLALEKTKYAIFLDTGLGKTSIEIEVAVQLAQNGIKCLIVCPLLVLTQFKREILKFYPWFKSSLEYSDDVLKELVGHESQVGIHLLRKSNLQAFKDSDDMIGLVNFEFFRKEQDLSGIGGFILDESSILKSENGIYGRNIINSCVRNNVHYRLAASATPAPNDYAELANHALFLGKIKTYSQFFGDWFQKDFKDQSRWLLRPHAKDKFYSYLSSWSILMRHPSRFGFSDNIEPPPDFDLFIDDLGATDEQIKMVAVNDEWISEKEIKKRRPKGEPEYDPEKINLWALKKGITIRGKLAQISKGFLYYYDELKKRQSVRVESKKPDYTFEKCYVEFPDDQVLIWTELDEEEIILSERFEGFDDFAIINGKTPDAERERLLNAFLVGEVRVLITKPKILGFGLNIQHIQRMIYYGISDSYERFYQSLRRAYRRGQTRRLQVYIPITELESPIMDNLNLKSESWEKLINEQENYFRDANNLG